MADADNTLNPSADNANEPTMPAIDTARVFADRNIITLAYLVQATFFAANVAAHTRADEDALEPEWDVEQRAATLLAQTRATCLHDIHAKVRAAKHLLFEADEAAHARAILDSLDADFGAIRDAGIQRWYASGAREKHFALLERARELQDELTKLRAEAEALDFHV